MHKALGIVAGSPRNIIDIRKVLRVWDERNIYPKLLIDEWSKLCDEVDISN